MSTIKPPSGPTGAAGAPPTDALEPAAGPRPSDPAQDLGGTQATGSVTGPTSAAAAGDAGAVGPLDALVADLQAGRVSPEAALDALVDRALADVDSQISPAQRAELEGIMRSILADDPTLSALRQGLDA